MKKTIFCITGLSGTGKSTIYYQLTRMMDRKPVIQYTSRPKRYGEMDGLHYNFIKSEELALYAATGKITCFESYQVANGEHWLYGYMKDDLYDGCILPMNPTSIDSLKQEDEYNVVSINLKVNEFIRLLRILKRKDNQGIKEIIRRSIQDKKTFKKYNFNYSIINKNIEDTCEKIINIIKKE